MTNQFTQRYDALLQRVLAGGGQASPADRKAAFDRADGGAGRALVDKIATRAWEISDEDVAAARAAGLAEDEIFELAICAALGAAKRQRDAARAALAEVK